MPSVPGCCGTNFSIQSLHTPGELDDYAVAKMRRYISALVLIVAVAHVLSPKHAELDWPTVALIGIVVLLIWSPELAKFFPFVKRLKIGEAEIEMHESVLRLHEDVQKAEELAPQLYIQSNLEAPAAVSEDSILELASRDKESAIVRLGIEIEKGLVTLLQKAGVADTPR